MVFIADVRYFHGFSLLNYMMIVDVVKLYVDNKAFFIFYFLILAETSGQLVSCREALHGTNKSIP